MMFSSRPPFNDDPAPLVHPSGKRTPAFSYHFEYEPGESGPFGVIARGRLAPRPEFDRPQHNPTNPILVAVRAEVARDPSRNHVEEWRDYCRSVLRPEGWRSKGRFTMKQFDHAYKVFTRLAKAQGGS